MLGPNMLTANQSSMTTDITGWSANFNCTVSRVTANFRSTPACGQLSTTSGASGVCNIVLATEPLVVVGATYTLQVWSRLSTTTGKLGRIKLSPADATFTDVGPNFVSPDVTLTTTYQKIEVSGVIPALATQVALVIEYETTVTGELGLWDDVFLAINRPLPRIAPRTVAAMRSALY